MKLRGIIFFLVSNFCKFNFANFPAIRVISSKVFLNVYYPLESWSKYTGIIEPGKVERVRSLLRRGEEVRQMMTVVGEEGTTIQDFTLMIKSEFFDSSYLQQNAFDRIDVATLRERQQFVFDKVLEVLNLDFEFEENARFITPLRHAQDPATPFSDEGVAVRKKA